MSVLSRRAALLPALSLVLVLFGGGCSSPSRNEKAVPEAATTAPLMEKMQNPRVIGTARDALAFYQKIRASFDQTTPNLYLSLVRYQDPKDQDKQNLIDEWQDASWRQDERDSAYPDISQNELVGFAMNGDQAAYHYVVRGYGTSRINIQSLLFVRENGFWKVIADVNQDSIAVETTPEKQQQAFRDYTDTFFRRNESAWGVYRYADETHLTHLILGDVDLLTLASGTVATLPYRSTYRMSLSEKGIEQIAGHVNINTDGYGYGLSFDSPVTQTAEQTFIKNLDFPESTRGKDITMVVRLTGENDFDVREVRTILFRFGK